METKKQTLLEIQNLSISFQRYAKGLKQEKLEVISDMHLRVNTGEVVAIVGSSGSGKSLLASAILGILPKNAKMKGTIYYKGKILTEQFQKELRGSEIALVPQAVTYLDPLMKVGEQVDGHKKVREIGKRKQIFERFSLPKETEKLYPFQLSGGMIRRVLVSTALLTDAELIIADEPTPGMGMDQALEALKMFHGMAEEGKSVILITHDIDLAYLFADKIAVIYGGTTVEVAHAHDFKNGEKALRHPYSKALWKALPQNGFEPISGIQPYAGSVLKGCIFAPRCTIKTKECEEKVPPMREVRGGEVRCYHVT